MRDLIPVFREGSPVPLGHDYVETLCRPLVPHWQPTPMSTYEVVATAGVSLPSNLRRLEIGQKMLFVCSPVQAANAARNASAYGMHLRVRTSAKDGGVWIGRCA